MLENFQIPETYQEAIKNPNSPLYKKFINQQLSYAMDLSAYIHYLYQYYFELENRKEKLRELEAELETRTTEEFDEEKDQTKIQTITKSKVTEEKIAEQKLAELIEYKNKIETEIKGITEKIENIQQTIKNNEEQEAQIEQELKAEVDDSLDKIVIVRDEESKPQHLTGEEKNSIKEAAPTLDDIDTVLESLSKDRNIKAQMQQIAHENSGENDELDLDIDEEELNSELIESEPQSNHWVDLVKKEGDVVRGVKTSMTMIFIAVVCQSCNLSCGEAERTLNANSCFSFVYQETTIRDAITTYCNKQRNKKALYMAKENQIALENIHSQLDYYIRNPNAPMNLFAPSTEGSKRSEPVYQSSVVKRIQ